MAITAKGKANRRLLIDASLKLLVEQPAEEITVTMVAEKAGIARGLVFYYFADKESLMKQVLLAFLERNRALFLGNEAEDAPDADEWLRRESGIFLDLVSQHPHLMKMALAAAREGGDEPLEEEVEQFRAFIEMRIRKVFNLPTDDRVINAVLRTWGASCIDLAQRLSGIDGWDSVRVRNLLAAQLRAGLAELR